jgi:APA family basic amino acid/polyamine antiporter
VGFSIYLGYIVPIPPAAAKLAAVLIILLLTGVNYRGVLLGAAVQKTFTALKVLGLIIIIALAVLPQAASPAHSSPAGAAVTLSSFGVALVGCLWAYQGWFAVSWVAGEIRRPERNLPLALGLGVGIVMAVYMGANLAYFRVLSIQEIAASDRVAAMAAERMLGPAGGRLVSITILVSIVGALNSGILAAPRVYFAQARDGLFFSKLGEVHPRYVTPAFSILVQGIWASVLALSGSYETLFSYVIFTSWIFYAMTVAAVIILRKTRPDLPRPYRMWGYPVTPVLFVAVSLGFVINTVLTKPGPSLTGLGLLATGIPAYLFWQNRSRRYEGRTHESPALRVSDH